MDAKWDRRFTSTINDDGVKAQFAAYSASCPEISPTTEGEREQITDAINKITEELDGHPYHPMHWLERSLYFLRLQDPVQALGDACKAWLLTKGCRDTGCSHTRQVRDEMLQSYPKSQKPVIISRIKQLEDDALLAICQGMFFANCISECLGALNLEFLSGYPLKMGDLRRLREAAQDAWTSKNALSANDPDFQSSQNRLYTGSVYPQRHPWTCDSYPKPPGEDDLARLDTMVKERSRNLCLFKKREPTNDSQSSNSFGVFATVALAADQQVFLEHPSIVVTSEAKKKCDLCFKPQGYKTAINGCCSSFIYCSKECMATANSLFHIQHSNCTGRDKFTSFRAPFKASKTSAEVKSSDGLLDVLMHRVLISCIKRFQESGEHPLDQDVIRRLKSSYNYSSPIDFSFNRDIFGLFNALHENGLDVFKHPEFDVWVLQEISARVKNNTWQFIEEETKKGKEIKTVKWHGISQMLSLFNHSRRPNITVQKSDRDASLIFKTLRPVKAGEELLWGYSHEDDPAIVDHDPKRKKPKSVSWLCACRCEDCNAKRPVNPQPMEEAHFSESKENDQDIRIKSEVRTQSPSPINTVEEILPQDLKQEKATPPLPQRSLPADAPTISPKAEDEHLNDDEDAGSGGPREPHIDEDDDTKTSSHLPHVLHATAELDEVERGTKRKFGQCETAEMTQDHARG